MTFDATPRLPGRDVDRSGLGLIVVAGLASWLGALYLADLGLEGQALWLAAAGAATTLLAGYWWRRRGTRAGQVAAGVFVPAAFGVWTLAGNLTGMPIVGVAVCAVVVEFGVRVGFVAAVALVGALGWAYAGADVPARGVLANVVMTALFLALGVLAARLLAQVEAARRLAVESVEAKRLEALSALDRTLAAERMAQARILHDDLGQRLTIIGMGLDLALRLRDRDVEAGWQEVERTRAAATEALGELRRLVRALSPLAADDAEQVDVDAALESLAGAFSGTGLAVDVVRDGAQRLDPLAYRIVQEGLTNVVRHSDARRVTITLRGGEQQTVRVADDGGRSPAPEPGFGLNHLRARVEASGGTFHAGSDGSGFVVDARYPVST